MCCGAVVTAGEVIDWTRVHAHGVRLAIRRIVASFCFRRARGAKMHDVVEAFDPRHGGVEIGIVGIRGVVGGTSLGGSVLRVARGLDAGTRGIDHALIQC